MITSWGSHATGPNGPIPPEKTSNIHSHFLHVPAQLLIWRFCEAFEMKIVGVGIGMV